jgi:hypothetical protein
MPLEVMKKLNLKNFLAAYFFLLFHRAAGGEGGWKWPVRLHAVFPARKGAEGTTIN